MSKPISSFKSTEEKRAAITRRIQSGTKGLGYWSAVSAAKILGVKTESKRFTEDEE